MKIVAFYLPQFHTIPENDEWWGSGFTEWTNVKKSVPLFEGHIQPETPLDGDYYDLLDDSVMVKQAAMAKKYGVDTFCYYHYWFEGKKLLEKPIEKMLNNKDVNIDFCLCWANENWTRNWDGNNSKIIMPQNYDEKLDAMTQHFYYLLNFFNDKRYIKKDNKPVLIIYKPYLIKNCEKMIDLWNQLAIKEGFSGIYWGFQFPESFNHNLFSIGFNFGIEFEPLYTVSNVDLEYKNKYLQAIMNPKWAIYKIKKKISKVRYKGLCVNDYDKTWNKINERRCRTNIMLGAFTGWDNTPRRGDNGTVYFQSTPDKFRVYFSKQLKKAKLNNIEYVFINAWNEWGEGAHLEPDEKWKYSYLEAVRDALEENK